MTRVLYTEHDYLDVNLERGVLEAAGIELVLGNCKTSSLRQARMPTLS
jgi:hypothetical protein